MCRLTGRHIRYCIAAQTPVNTVKQGSQTLSSVALGAHNTAKCVDA